MKAQFVHENVTSFKRGVSAKKQMDVGGLRLADIVVPIVEEAIAKCKNIANETDKEWNDWLVKTLSNKSIRGHMTKLMTIDNKANKTRSRQEKGEFTVDPITGYHTENLTKSIDEREGKVDIYRPISIIIGNKGGMFSLNWRAPYFVGETGASVNDETEEIFLEEEIEEFARQYLIRIDGTINGAEQEINKKLNEILVGKLVSGEKFDNFKVASIQLDELAIREHIKNHIKRKPEEKFELHCGLWLKDKGGNQQRVVIDEKINID